MTADLSLISKQLAASHDELQLSVHVVGESVYCPRAGLIAFEEKREDSGEETGAGRLDYLPRYELWEIRRALDAKLGEAWQWLAVIGILIALGTVLGFLVSRYFYWSTPVAVIPLAIPLARVVRQILVLEIRLRQAERCSSRMPDPNSPAQEPINWWEMVRAGFTATRYHERLLDEASQLAGKPWRVLRRGSQVIPVFRRRGSGPLRRPQITRIVGYCVLVQLCEGMESPYGLVLDPEGYGALAVKCTTDNGEQFVEAVGLARQTIKAATGDPADVDKPPDLKPCKKCVYARPRRYRFGGDSQSGGRAMPVHGISSADGKSTLHSTCGDRFCWTPPHERLREQLRHTD